MTVICCHLLAVRRLSTSFSLGITWQKVYLPQKETFGLRKLKRWQFIYFSNIYIIKGCGHNAVTTSALMGSHSAVGLGSHSRAGVAESGGPALQQHGRSGASRDFTHWASSRKTKSFTLFSTWRYTHFSRPPSCHLENDFLSEES